MEKVKSYMVEYIDDHNNKHTTFTQNKQDVKFLQYRYNTNAVSLLKNPPLSKEKTENFIVSRSL